MSSFLRRGLQFGAALLALATALLGAMAALSLDAAPRLHAAESPPEAMAEVHRLLRTHDPRRARPGALYAVRLSPQDVAVLADHAAKRAGGAAELRLLDGRMRARASLPLRGGSRGPWLNVDAMLVGGTGWPRLESLRLGDLPVPAPVANWAARRLLAWAEGQADADREPLHRMVRQVSVRPEGLTIHYRWRADATTRVIERLLPPAQRDRLQAHTERLAALTADGDAPIELTSLLVPLAAFAAERSEDTRTAAAENRAWLQALALYVNGRQLASVMPAAGDWPRPRLRPVLLAGRVDAPQHFVLSALLAAETGGPFADALGLGKELDDSRRGSGFSFTDIAANRAGARLGALAVESPRQLQRTLAAGVGAEALMPDIGDLSEYMPETEFRARYGGVGAPAYQRMLAEIDARIAALSLYR